MKVWENSKKLLKHLPAAHVPTAFLVLPNFHSYFNGITKVFMYFMMWLVFVADLMHALIN